MLDEKRALVLHSGGQDSTTCLAWALNQFEHVETVGFSYGQRHVVELECRISIRERLAAMSPEWRARLGEDHMIDLAVLGTMNQTALTSEVEFSMTAEGLPTTFVPGRNLAFLTFAAIVAYRRNTKNIVAGVCETDFSGYPDCRDDTIKAMQLVLNLGMARQFAIHTPLMWIDKAETWALAECLGGQDLVRAIVEYTHTCYRGKRDELHEWGYGCGLCPACELRAAGHHKFVERAMKQKAA
jgi:7-cyano-7-deazaguanine synthase